MIARRDGADVDEFLLADCVVYFRVPVALDVLDHAAKSGYFVAD